jgi:hypothetical protein
MHTVHGKYKQYELGEAIQAVESNMNTPAWNIKNSKVIRIQYMGNTNNTNRVKQYKLLLRKKYWLISLSIVEHAQKLPPNCHRLSNLKSQNRPIRCQLT